MLADMVQVVEAYSDYAPPCDAAAAVTALLASAPAEKVAGLRTVVLTNRNALKGSRKRGWSWHRGRKSKHTHSLGMYHAKARGEEAWIELFVDQIVGDTPRWALRLSVVRTLVCGPTVYHELGHHIHKRHQPERREPEDVADAWKTTLLRGHVRRRHPLARILLLPVAWTVQRWLGRRRPSMASR
jgi:hypothetical protein